MDKVQILGVPMDLGQGRRGVDMGPSAVRYAGLNETIRRLGYTVHDRGNLQVPIPEEDEIDKNGSEVPHLKTVTEVNSQLADRVEEAFGSNSFSVILGGDHSIAAGSIVGARRRERVGVFWIDAHGDYNNPTTSPSGNLHGMPLSAIVGRGPTMAPYKDESQIIRPQEIILVGVRSLDLKEKKRMLEDGVLVFTIRDIDELGIAEVTRRGLNHFSRLGLERIYVSLDLDVLDVQFAPGVGTPVPGGISYREAHLLMELIAEDQRAVGLDLVEVNPILDMGNKTAEMAVGLTASLLGDKIL